MKNSPDSRAFFGCLPKRFFIILNGHLFTFIILQNVTYMIWLFIHIFIAFWTYMGIELYLYFRKPKDHTDWANVSEWAWRRSVRKAIDDMLK